MTGIEHNSGFIEDVFKNLAQLAVRGFPLPLAVELDGMVKMSLGHSKSEFPKSA